MGCADKLSKSIISDCTTQKSGNLEVVAYLFNRLDAVLTYDVTNPSLITSIANAATKTAYKVTGVRKMLNAGHDIVKADDRPDKYAHYFAFQQFELLAEDIENVDAMEDIFVVVERKDKSTTGEGVFGVYGPEFGLEKSTDTRRANDINGARNLELLSIAGNEEKYSNYTLLATDYATTKTLLETLVSTPGV
jgi:hypothetical protein